MSAPGLVQQINQVQVELDTLRDEMHHSLLHDKHKCINDLYVIRSFSILSCLCVIDEVNARKRWSNVMSSWAFLGINLCAR